MPCIRSERLTILPNSKYNMIWSINICSFVFGVMILFSSAIFGQTPSNKYFFSEASYSNGSIVFDSSATPLNDTVRGTGVTIDAAGKVGKGIKFNGVNNNYVATGGTSLTGNWSLAVWVYRTNTTNSSGSVLLGGKGGTADTCIKLEQNNTNYRVAITKGSVTSTFNSNYSVPQNSWVHLVFVKNTTNITLYVNGVASGTTTTLINIKRPGVIGANYAFQNVINGKIDELYVYNGTALTSTQVSTLYNSYDTLNVNAGT